MAMPMAMNRNKIRTVRYNDDDDLAAGDDVDDADDADDGMHDCECW